MLFAAILSVACAETDGIVQVQSDFMSDRAAHPTTLLVKRPSPQDWPRDSIPDPVRTVRYPSAVGDLQGWIWDAPGPGPHPVVVYFHGGFAWGLDDLAVCRPFVEAGYTVFTPSWRGENGNPGNHEYFYGELDDALAAIRWIATQPGIDPKRISTFGHSAGGVLSGMIALVPDVEVEHTGSAGGIYPEASFDTFDQFVPFDRKNVTERRLRGWVHYLGSMKRPHHAWIGRQDWLARWVPELERDAEAAHAPLTVTLLPGDHGEELEAAIYAYLLLVLGPA